MILRFNLNWRDPSERGMCSSRVVERTTTGQALDIVGIRPIE
jgi:hypothetical protein